MPHDHTDHGEPRARQLPPQRKVKNASASILLKKNFHGAEAAPNRTFKCGEFADPNIEQYDIQDDDDAWSIDEVCKYFGGLKPINKATIYKWIRDKGFPEPVKYGKRTSRWMKSEVVAYRRNIVAGRGKRV